MSVLSDGKKRLALVVGSGAVKCAAALGLWQVLEDEHIKIDMFVGCSGGSLYTALMAAGGDLETATQKTMQLWTRQVTARRNTRALLQALFPSWLKFDGRFAMIDDRTLNKNISQAFGNLMFSDLKAPLHIVATDFHSGEQVEITAGRLSDAIRASVSIPYIWPAWPLDGRLLVDGSFSNPMPVDVAIKNGAEIILAMGFASPYPRRIKSLSRFAFHLNSVMTNNLFDAKFAFHNLAHHAEIIPIMPEFEGEINLFDIDKIPQVIERGAQAMREQVSYLKRLFDNL